MSLATKGETIEDTAATLSAMGVNVVVVRHSKPGFPNLIMSAFEGHVINAGDGAHAHPTQGLLDLFTIRREFGRIEGLRVALIGDIVHSRVANSTVNGLLQLGAEVVLVGPEVLLPASYSRDGVEIERDFERMLPEVDVVILLRIQRERFNAETMSDADFIAGYQLNAARLPKLKPGAIVMHPGPYNRGMELDDAVTEFTGWRYARQVHNGVYVRMAVLDFLVNGAA
jgi:aspartate carbamoyltransferase catalytic subunit